MKKLFIAMVAATAMWGLTACSGGNTPSGVASQAVECIQEKNYDGYVELMYNKAENDEEAEAQKQLVAGMLKSKAEKTFEKRGGIVSYEVTSEEISEDGETAKVGMKIVYGDGEEDNQTLKMRKDSDGNWKMDMGK